MMTSAALSDRCSFAGDQNGKSVLVGDLGGTHTRLALAELQGEHIVLQQVRYYRNREHRDLAAIIADFSDVLPHACCLAVAGPTDGSSVRFTNLDWQIEAADLGNRFGFRQCRLINDFAAVGWGLNCLSSDALATLQSGVPQPGGTRVALGAGTGFGVSLCPWHGQHFRPLASEGGHVGFAPVNPHQDRLLLFLRQRYGRASVERILSGPGLIDLYRFCLAEQGRHDSTLLQSDQSAAAISQAGLSGQDEAAVACLRLFAEIYGQTAGDWALAAQAGGGIFLAGGIAPKLLPVLSEAGFLGGFHDKGHYRDWMHRVPVAVILDPDIGLKGAAYAAWQD
jgi:glucokinase